MTEGEELVVSSLDDLTFFMKNGMFQEEFLQVMALRGLSSAEVHIQHQAKFGSWGLDND